MRNELQTENETLKIKIQEINETQSNMSQYEHKIINSDLIFKENESVQTDGIAFPINANEVALRNQQKYGGKGTAFDYEVMVNTQDEKKLPDSDDEEDEIPRKPPTCKPNSTMNGNDTARTDRDLVDAMVAKNKKEMNTLQHRYELRITELLENHMSEIQETKKVSTVVTIRKLERILILELEKM